MKKQISRAEARRLRARVVQLEAEQAARIRSWCTDYPGGVHIATCETLNKYTDGKLAASALLGAALVGRWDDSAQRLLVYAVLPKS